MTAFFRTLMGQIRSRLVFEEYVAFYNSQRPLQVIRHEISKPGELEMKGVGFSGVLS
jgi:hypothetical protein